MDKLAAPRNRNKVNLALDIAIFGAVLAALQPRLTGMAIHEWLGIAFGVGIVTHLLLHWQWIVEVTKRFLARTSWSARVNYILNGLLFIDITVIIFTGLMISKVALPSLGLQVAQGFAWRSLHGQASDVAVFLVGLHVALHWKWIVNTIKRYVIAPLLPGRHLLQLSLTARQPQKEA